jgi:hypothetical protein
MPAREKSGAELFQHDLDELYERRDDQDEHDDLEGLLSIPSVRARSFQGIDKRDGHREHESDRESIPCGIHFLGHPEERAESQES